MRWSWIILVLYIYVHLPDNVKSEELPRFKRTFANFSTVVGKKEIKLICQVVASPDTRYWWLKDGKRIDATKLKFRYKQFRYMKIRNVKKTDAGEYTCVASNKAGRIKHTTQLYISDPKTTESPKITEYAADHLITVPVVQIIHNVTAFEGDNVTVLCKAYSDDIPIFEWLIYNKVYKNMTAVKPSMMKEHKYLLLSSEKRLHVFQLFLPNVSFEDQMEYTCLAGNYYGFTYKSFFLRILPRGLETKPWFTKPERMDKEFLLFPAGNSVQLICDASGNPEPTVVWYKNGKRFKKIQREPYPIKPDQFTLNLRSLNPDDSGEYKCNVSNELGYINKNYILEVQDRLVSKPIVHEINNVTAYEGENVTVICKAYCDTITDFKWLIYNKDSKNMAELRPNMTERQYLFPSGGNRLHGVKLFLPNVSFEDQREYTCLAVNYIGIDHQAFFLKVLPRIYTSVSQSTVAAAREDDSYTIDGFGVMIVIVPVVALFVLVMVVLLMWLFSMRRKRHQADVSLRHTVYDVANGDLVLTEAKKNLS